MAGFRFEYNNNSSNNSESDDCGLYAMYGQARQVQHKQAQFVKYHENGLFYYNLFNPQVGQIGSPLFTELIDEINTRDIMSDTISSSSDMKEEKNKESDENNIIEVIRYGIVCVHAGTISVKRRPNIHCGIGINDKKLGQINTMWEWIYFSNNDNKHSKVCVCRHYQCTQNLICNCFAICNKIEMKPNCGIYCITIRIDHTNASLEKYANMLGITSNDFINQWEKYNNNEKNENKQNMSWQMFGDYIGWNTSGSLFAGEKYTKHINYSKFNDKKLLTLTDGNIISIEYNSDEASMLCQKWLADYQDQQFCGYPIVNLCHRHPTILNRKSKTLYKFIIEWN